MALQFTTNGDALANVTDTSFFLASTSPQSISVWINALWDGATKTSSYVGMYNGAGSTAAIQIGSRIAQGQCDIWSWGGAIILSSTGVTVPSNTWINITYTFDGTTARLYYNGVLNNSAAYAPAAINFNQVFLNGYTSGGVGETATFQVDTYEYYARALSASEIQTMVSTQGNRHGIVYQELLRYEFDEGVVGVPVAAIFNQSPQVGTASNNLVSNSVRTPAVTFAAGYVSHNLRPPV
jgi:hypothetical protein